MWLIQLPVHPHQIPRQLDGYKDTKVDDSIFTISITIDDSILMRHRVRAKRFGKSMRLDLAMKFRRFG